MCQLWATLGRLPGGEPIGVSFRYDPSRSAETALQVLEGFEGLFLADGLQSYDAALKHPTMRGRVVRAHCWAHARRGFSDALDLGESRARHPLELIGRIYRAEKECQEALAGAWDRRGEELLALRKEKLAPAIEALFTWAREQAKNALPKDRLGKAVGYLINHVEGLRVCLAHAGCDLDNNIVERAIRPVAIGRKNWLFAGSDDGAERLACLLSLVGTCKMLGIDADAYLAEVLMECKRRRERKDDRREDLTPYRWAVAKGLLPESR